MFNKASSNPELIKKLADNGLEVVGGPGSLATERIKNERTYWAPIVKSSGISLE